MNFNFNFVSIFKKKGPKSKTPENTLDYWRTRAKKFGKQAVISIDHSKQEFDEIKDRDRNILFPFLKPYLTGREEMILDFGCGVGRFTEELSNIAGCKAVGVDPTEELINLARKSKKVEFRAVKAGKIPLPDQSIDLIWIYAVLGCVKDADMPEVSQELNRVLKKDGVLFVTENTSEVPDSEHYSYRSADKYMAMLPFADLSHLHDYRDIVKTVEEKFSVMAGKKKD